MTVKIYGKPNCVQCTATSTYMNSRNIPFEYIDISKSESDYELVKSLGYSQVPVVTHGDTHWSGFQPDRINSLGV